LIRPGRAALPRTGAAGRAGAERAGIAVARLVGAGPGTRARLRSGGGGNGQSDREAGRAEEGEELFHGVG